MRLGDGHTHHMRQPAPQEEVALCEPAVFLLLLLVVQTPVGTLVQVVVLM
jgi:hypothetical protein